MSNVVVVYHSGYGHTRVMAQAVAQGVERHSGSTCQLIPVEEVEDHWDRLHRADAIIFGAPTYMGSASAPFKEFMEATAAFYLAQPWRDKLAAGFTNSGSLCGDKLNTLLQMAVFAIDVIFVGSGEFAYLEGGTWRASRGPLMIAPSGLPHRVRFTSAWSSSPQPWMSPIT